MVCVIKQGPTQGFLHLQLRCLEYFSEVCMALSPSLPSISDPVPYLQDLSLTTLSNVPPLLLPPCLHSLTYYPFFWRRSTSFSSEFPKPSGMYWLCLSPSWNGSSRRVSDTWYKYHCWLLGGSCSMPEQLSDTLRACTRTVKTEKGPTWNVFPKESFQFSKQPNPR